MKTKEVALLYKGSAFLLKVVDGEMINLTDLWRAAGMPEEQDPYRWLKLPTTSKFIEALRAHPIGQKSPNWKSPESLLKTVRGRHGGTYAHWQIAMAYAKYLSPELHLLVNEVFRERLQETIDPELGLIRSRKRAVRSWEAMGRDQLWIAHRIKGIDQRNEYTSTLGAHGVHGRGYGECTNAIYIPILHGGASDVKEARNIPQNKNLRDYLDECEIAGIQLAEALAKRNIKESDAYGTVSCANESNRAGRAVHVALEMAQAMPARRITAR